MKDIRTVTAMGTVVTIEVIGSTVDREGGPKRRDAIDRALAWFGRIEECCSRFDPDSELMQLVAQTGAAVPVSPILFEAVQFALAVAEATGGAFDPTVGRHMEERGFNRNYRTGRIGRTAIDVDDRVSFRDVLLDPDRQTVTCVRPLVLDLGSIAKGLAIDMAARELQAFEDYAIDAGGDLFLAGCNGHGRPWSVGVHHPRNAEQLLGALRVSDRAVCTSGDYVRTSPLDGNGHHMDPRTGGPATSVASVTVVAPTAVLADALGTAAFVLGPREGIALFERQGVDGLIVSGTLEHYATEGMERDYDFCHQAPAEAECR